MVSAFPDAGYAVDLWFRFYPLHPALSSALPTATV